MHRVGSVFIFLLVCSIPLVHSGCSSAAQQSNDHRAMLGSAPVDSTIRYRATGTNREWDLEIPTQGQLRFTDNSTGQIYEFPAPPEIDDLFTQVVRYDVRAGDIVLVLNTRRISCSVDDGRVYESTVEVSIGDAEYYGCGEVPEGPEP